MSTMKIPAPDELPTPFEGPPTDLAERVLELYRRVAEAEELRDRAIAQAEAAHAAERQRSDHAIAQLAAERFELGRLLQRIVPAMEGSLELAREARALELFARRWDQVLDRLEIEVRNPAGLPLNDELTEVLEVENAVADSDVTATRVRETLFPIVRFQDRTVGIGKVITSVPAQPPENDPKEGS